jgi:hypothetical protein
MKKTSSRIGGIVFVLIGAVFAAFSWQLYKADQVFIQQSVPAMGTVVKLEYVRSEKAEPTYYPVVAFQTPDGKKYQFRNTTGTTRRKRSYQEGTQIEIRYEIQNPANAKIAGFWELWGLTAILGGFGLLFVLVGVIIGLK